MRSELKIFILYPYYWPHYKAGGPTQSLFNLAAYFKAKAQFFIISLDKDIDNTNPEVLIEKSKWTKGPNDENIIFTSKITFHLIYTLIKQIKPSLIYVNGLFNATTTIPGLICGNIFKIKLIISPRGMLQPWALDRKPFKKKLYILCTKFLMPSKSEWHATDENEQNDIKRIFGLRFPIHMAPNIPRQVSEHSRLEISTNTVIKLLFLSLINKNKNLHLVIDMVNKNKNFSLDIIGPIADKTYWDICLKMIQTTRIEYMGSIPSWSVPTRIKNYHFFVLPTMGENFGHAIFDSLASGVPVITTANTPWKDIEDKECGFYIDLSQRDSLEVVLDRIFNLTNNQYQLYRINSLNYADAYLKSHDYDSLYSFLIR